MSLFLLFISMSALVSGIKEGVNDVEDAAFLPVAAFVVTLSYMLGFSKWSTRRAWVIMLTGGVLAAFIESAELFEPIRSFLQAIPQFELEIIRWVFEKEVPDISILQTQFAEIIVRVNAFTSRLWSLSFQHPSIREFLWDIPLIVLAAWAGWGTSRQNKTLTALVPSIALHAFILNYTGRDTLSLQIAVFALILLIGVNQKWSLTLGNTGNAERATRETYSAIIILSIAVTIAAGLMPSISIKDIAQRLAQKDEIGEALGLEKKVTQIFTTKGISGLPRQHLIGISPKLSNTVVLKVKTGELVPSEDAIIEEAIPRHYWRWLVYDIYNGQGWATSPVKNDPYSANELLIPLTSEWYQVIHLQVEKSFTEDNRLYWTGSLVTASQPFNASWRTAPESLPANTDPLLNADMLGAVMESQSYQADALVPLVTANQLRASAQSYPQEVSQRYLALPDSVSQRTRILARDLTANISNPYDKAKAIEAHLRTYPYSLNVDLPPQNRDIADYFLFDLKTGYCDYYATSMIVLARAVGLPARMVIGYASGIYDPTRAEYVVREADAHSWVEIYFAEIGWVEFEPTASQPQIVLPEGSPEEFTPSLLPFEFDSEQAEITYTKTGFFPKKNYSFPIFGLAAILPIIALWILRRQGLLKSHKTIGSIYEYVYFHGKKIYSDAQLHETPLIFADKLKGKLKTDYQWLNPAQIEIDLLTEFYIKESYSAHPVTRDEQKLAGKIWRKLFWRLLYARMVVRL